MKDSISNCNIVGEQIKSTLIPEKNIEIELPDINGLYLIQLVDGNGLTIQTKKVIKLQ